MSQDDPLIAELRSVLLQIAEAREVLREANNEVIAAKVGLADLEKTRRELEDELISGRPKYPLIERPARIAPDHEPEPGPRKRRKAAEDRP